MRQHDQRALQAHRHAMTELDVSQINRTGQLWSLTSTPLPVTRTDIRAAAVQVQVLPCWATGGASAGSKAEENR
jgi:hypothetical protein